MDKYDKVIEMTEHPENFSEQELERMLKDDEIREIYNLLCDTHSALCPFQSISPIEIDREWEKLQGHIRKPRLTGFLAFSRRTAAVLAVVFTTLASVALGIALAINRNSSNPVPQDVNSEQMATAHTCAVAPDTAFRSTNADTTSINTSSRFFENEPLGDLLKEISGYYGLTLRIDNRHAATLRLFFRWDRSKGAEDVLRQLNNFEKITLTLDNGVLTLK